jgi:hypothetical protein
MVRSGILPQTTLGGKHLSAHQVLASRGDPLRETRLNLPRLLNTRLLNTRLLNTRLLNTRLLNTRLLNRLHSTSINQYALGSTLSADTPNFSQSV